VTFGVRPAYAATGFGYIERGEPLAVAPQQPGAAQAQPPPAPAMYRVARFHEKPARAVAEMYVAAGGYYWNAGIFLWKARTILDALARHQPEIYRRLEAVSAAVDAPTFADVLQHQFAAMPKISIDYAVMEKAGQVAVVETTFAWDDVGSWVAFQRHQEQDGQGNSLEAPRHLAVNAQGTILRSTSVDQLVVLAGVRDLVVVVTPDAILVADKHDERSIAAVTEELQKRGWEGSL
jgi:mannose-1-phosphate guanylyltransferase